MKDQMTYKGFKDQIHQYGFSGDYHIQLRMIKRLEKILDENEIVHFYPQNMFLENEETIFYIFTDDRLFKVTDKEKKVRIAVLKYKDISHLDLETENYYGNDRSILNIKFSNEEPIVFDSNQDTNDSWSYAFEDKIIMIFKYLLTK